MYNLTLIGLGVEESDITVKAYSLLKNAKTVVLRTKNALSSKSVKSLNNIIV